LILIEIASAILSAKFWVSDGEGDTSADRLASWRSVERTRAHSSTALLLSEGVGPKKFWRGSALLREV